jgi:Family of unknown function (DUF5752)
MDSSRKGSNDDSRSQKQEVESSEVARILRTVPDKNAFYFYSSASYLGQNSYQGIRARSLTEFLEQVKTVNIASIEFHAKRGDFENWFLTTLGDATLSKEISLLKTREGEELRNSLVKTVGARLQTLEKFN